jgi:hypothetical protein
MNEMQFQKKTNRMFSSKWGRKLNFVFFYDEMDVSVVYIGFLTVSLARPSVLSL